MTASKPRVGFIGLGRMGLPMAMRLANAGYRLQVWNRSADAIATLKSLGARVSKDAIALFAESDIILMSLANEAATDEVLGRAGSRLEVPAATRTVIQLGTTSPGYSRLLAGAFTANGGRFIESPVSGSKKPAEDGTLIAMVGAGCDADFKLAETILAPLAARVFRCGQVGDAMTMKLVVNSYLIALVTGLSETWSLADALGIDLTVLRDVLDAGPMASGVSRMKLEKLASGDMSAQASITDVLMNARLVTDLARQRSFPLLLGKQCEGLLANAVARGFGDSDMIAVGKIVDTPYA